ncbi:MAG TPA: hypothetical protein VGC79_36890, partial [Polyangiaceae bacterium]
PHDASNRNSDAWARLRHYVEKTNPADNGRDRPGLVSCTRPKVAPVAPAYDYDDDDDDDGPITTRWAVG